MSESHPQGDQHLVGYSDIIGTVTKEDNSDEEYGVEVAVSELQPTHVDRQLLSCLGSDSDRESCNSKQQPILGEEFDKGIDLVLVIKIKRKSPVK